MDRDVGDLPRHGRCLHGRAGADLHARSVGVRQLHHAGHHHVTDSSYLDRHRARARHHGQGIHGHVDDRLHCPGGHHRAQLHPIGRVLARNGGQGASDQ